MTERGERGGGPAERLAAWMAADRPARDAWRAPSGVAAVWAHAHSPALAPEHHPPGAP